MKILIVYGTSEGQTRKIARYMETVLEDLGYHATIADVGNEPPAPELYDAVLIGGSMHLQRYQKKLKRYVSNHLSILNGMPSGFFSVCMSLAAEDEAMRNEARKIATDFVKSVGWMPDLMGHIAGALKFTQYGFFTKRIMKRISKNEGHDVDPSKDYEFTDWRAVETFVTSFAEQAMRALVTT